MNGNQEKIREIVLANVEVGEFSMRLTEQGISKLAAEYNLRSVDEFKSFFMDEVSSASVALNFPKRFGCPRSATIESALKGSM